MDGKRFPRRLLVAVTVGVLVVCGLFAMIPLLGASWHLMHGDYLAYHEWRVPVPRGFYVTGIPDHPTMFKHTLGVPTSLVPMTQIFLSSNSRRHPPK